MQSVLWAVIEMEKSVVGIQAKENYRAKHLQLKSYLLYCLWILIWCVADRYIQLSLRVTRNGFVVSRGNQLILAIQAGDLWLVAKMGMQGSGTLHWRELLLSSVDTHKLWPVSNGILKHILRVTFFLSPWSLLLRYMIKLICFFRAMPGGCELPFIEYRILCSSERSFWPH